MTIFDTSAYELSHGKKPRGTGHWLFCVVNPNRNDYLDYIVAASGMLTYSEAKKIISERHYTILYVCP